MLSANKGDHDYDLTMYLSNLQHKNACEKKKL